MPALLGPEARLHYRRQDVALQNQDLPEIRRQDGGRR
jgi:hypothetical protein